MRPEQTVEEGQQVGSNKTLPGASSLIGSPVSVINTLIRQVHFKVKNKDVEVAFLLRWLKV